MITVKKILYKYIVIIIMSYQSYNRIYLKIESCERSNNENGVSKSIAKSCSYLLCVKIYIYIEFSTYM